ncbi:MAG TPA: hypothetical protein VJK54_05270, partial [Chthoniobacterales bacterium]|nr:hypothetical protein [Chthoniobacterales bacterium]
MKLFYPLLLGALISSTNFNFLLAQDENRLKAEGYRLEEAENQTTEYELLGCNEENSEIAPEMQMDPAAEIATLRGLLDTLGMSAAEKTVAEKEITAAEQAITTGIAEKQEAISAATAEIQEHGVTSPNNKTTNKAKANEKFTTVNAINTKNAWDTEAIKLRDRRNNKNNSQNALYFARVAHIYEIASEEIDDSKRIWEALRAKKNANFLNRKDTCIQLLENATNFAKKTHSERSEILFSQADAAWDKINNIVVWDQIAQRADTATDVLQYFSFFGIVSPAAFSKIISLSAAAMDNTQNAKEFAEKLEDFARKYYAKVARIEAGKLVLTATRTDWEAKMRAKIAESESFERCLEEAEKIFHNNPSEQNLRKIKIERATARVQADKDAFEAFSSTKYNLDTSEVPIADSGKSEKAITAEEKSKNDQLLCGAKAHLENAKSLVEPAKRFIEQAKSLPRKHKKRTPALVEAAQKIQKVLEAYNIATEAYKNGLNQASPRLKASWYNEFERAEQEKKIQLQQVVEAYRQFIDGESVETISRNAVKSIKSSANCIVSAIRAVKEGSKAGEPGSIESWEKYPWINYFFSLVKPDKVLLPEEKAQEYFKIAETYQKSVEECFQGFHDIMTETKKKEGFSSLINSCLTRSRALLMECKIKVSEARIKGNPHLVQSYTIEEKKLTRAVGLLLRAETEICEDKLYIGAYMIESAEAMIKGLEAVEAGKASLAASYSEAAELYFQASEAKSGIDGDRLGDGAEYMEKGAEVMIKEIEASAIGKISLAESYKKEAEKLKEAAELNTKAEHARSSGNEQCSLRDAAKYMGKSAEAMIKGLEASEAGKGFLAESYEEAARLYFQASKAYKEWREDEIHSLRYAANYMGKSAEAMIKGLEASEAGKDSLAESYGKAAELYLSYLQALEAYKKEKGNKRDDLEEAANYMGKSAEAMIKGLEASEADKGFLAGSYEEAARLYLQASRAYETEQEDEGNDFSSAAIYMEESAEMIQAIEEGEADEASLVELYKEADEYRQALPAYKTWQKDKIELTKLCIQEAEKLEKVAQQAEEGIRPSEERVDARSAYIKEREDPVTKAFADAREAKDENSWQKAKVAAQEAVDFWESRITERTPRTNPLGFTKAEVIIQRDRFRVKAGLAAVKELAAKYCDDCWGSKPDRANELMRMTREEIGSIVTQVIQDFRNQPSEARLLAVREVISSYASAAAVAAAYDSANNFSVGDPSSAVAAISAYAYAYSSYSVSAAAAASIAAYVGNSCDSSLIYALTTSAYAYAAATAAITLAYRVASADSATEGAEAAAALKDFEVTSIANIGKCAYQTTEDNCNWSVSVIKEMRSFAQDVVAFKQKQKRRTFSLEPAWKCEAEEAWEKARIEDRTSDWKEAGAAARVAASQTQEGYWYSFIWPHSKQVGNANGY